MVENAKDIISTTVSIRFQEFLVRAFPKTKNTLLPKIVTNTILDLEPCCEKDEDDAFVFARGGAVRAFSLPFDAIGEHLNEKVRQTDFGTDNLTRNVMEHAFGEEKDLDLYIRRGKNSSDQDLINSINNSLYQTQGNPYRTEVKTQAIGGKANPQTLFMINFYNNDEPIQKPVFMLNFTNFPVSPESSEKEIRIRGDVDTLSLSDLHKDANGDLVMDYTSPDFIDIRKRLINYYFSPRIGPLANKDNFLQDLSASFREINSRALYLPALFDSENNFMTTDLLISHRNFNAHTPATDEITQIIQVNRTEIEDNLLPLLSDIIFSFVANPIIALPLSYFNKSLIMTPLGRMINSPEKMREVLKFMAERMELKITDAFSSLAMNYAINYPNTLLLLDALKDTKVIPEDWPRSYEGLLQLLNPLELINIKIISPP